MADNVLTCLTCRVAFADLEVGRDHYRSDWHRYNVKREVAKMSPVTADVFKNEVVPKHDTSSQEESGNCFCQVCEKPFHSKNSLQNHLRSKKHREMEAIAKKHGIEQPKMTQSTSKTEKSVKDTEPDEGMETDSETESWDEEEEVIGLEECLFCSHISSSLETNLHHMTQRHSFFLPDAEYISDLEGLVVHLGEMISQGHMCLWCHDRSKMFRRIPDVQKHMVDKGHCKMKHDDTNWGSYADFYDYRSSYPDADNTTEEDAIVDPETLVSNGFELVLPSGATIGHRSLSCYYKQNHGRRQCVIQTRTPLSKVLAGYRALGWTGCSGAAVKKRAKDIHFMQRLKNKYQMKTSIRANKMQFHYREQNPI